MITKLILLNKCATIKVQKHFICSKKIVTVVGVTEICVVMIEASSASSRNVRIQFEVLEIYFGSDIGFLHDFDHSSLSASIC